MINQRTFALGVIISVGLLSGCGASLDDKGALASLIPAKTAKLPPGTAASLSQANSKWSDVSEPGNIVTASGFSSEAIFGQNKDTPSEPETDDSAAVKIAYDSSGNISGLSVINDNVNLTWNDGFKENIRDSSLTVTDGNEAQGMIYDPENSSEWNYQTMATWLLTDEAKGTGRIGAMSVGNQTAVASIPTTSTATFTGVAEGMYITDSLDFYGVSSVVELEANFGDRSVEFTTTDSKIHDIDTRTTSEKNDLNLTGTFTYSEDVNQLTTTSLSTTSGWTGGEATAKFYGPNAEEIGGVFSIRGTGKQAYEGAFGAKK